MGPLLQILVVALVVAGLAYAFWYRQLAFSVRIGDGVPKVTKGHVHAGLLQEIADVCQEHQIKRGTIRGIRGQNRIRLSFSGDIPPGCQQRLRNVWTAQSR